MDTRSTGTFTLGNYMRVAAARYGDREAYYCTTTGRRITFRQFNERVNRLANGLISLGVGKGDVTAFLSMNRVEVVETYGALGKIGSIGMPLNYRLSPAEIADLVNFSDAENIIFDPFFSDMIKDMKGKLPKVKRLVAMGDSVPDFALGYEDLLAGSPETEPDVEISDCDPQYLNLTSGTTGMPKAYMLSQYNNCDAGPILVHSFDMTSRDVIMTVFPMFGRVGYAWSMGTLLTGARNVIFQFDLNKILGIIEQEKVTISNWVPTIASFILVSPDLDKYDLSSLRSLVFAAAPFPVSLQDQVKKRICPNLYEFYGLQETGILVSMGPKEKERKPESVGVLHFGSDIRIVDEKGRDVPNGQIGEIIGRGISVTSSYFKNEEKTKEVFKDGWFYTGDLGRLDGEGYLYLAGRKKDMIVSGGQNVFAVEVEETYMKHPAVMQCAVIGLPHEVWGEMVAAVIVKNPGSEVTEEELIAFGREKIAHFKVPKNVFFVDSLPMTPTGKVMKYILVERFSKK